MRAEEKRLHRGWTYEPPTFYEKNYDGEDSNRATFAPRPGVDLSFPVQSGHKPFATAIRNGRRVCARKCPYKYTALCGWS
jgi:hypothetical protein